MLKRTLASALAACVFASGLFYAGPAVAAADSSGSQTLQSRLKDKREEAKARKDQHKAERKARKDQRKADRAQRHENRKSFLSRLWPFGKKEEEQVPFPQQKRFGTGNPRDTSQSNGPTRPVTTVVKGHKNLLKRDGMNFTRNLKSKKKGAVQNQATASSRADKRYDRTLHSHKNGEFRKATRTHRHAPSGLNWNLQKKRIPSENKLNKNGKYRPGQ